MNQTLELLKKRKSIRKYTEEKIADKEMEYILKAAMAAPSATNARDWSFIVTRDRDIINKMAEANGRDSNPLKGAQMAVLVCGDLSRSCSATDYWIIDCSIAASFMNVAAESLGISSVWLGTWPELNKVEAQRKLFNLPVNIIPHSIISFGHADEDPNRPRIEWEADRVHIDKW